MSGETRTHFGFEEVAEQDKAARVDGVFTSVAQRYDLMNDVMSLGLHAYQAELYPTGIRAVAVGFVYGWSRISVVFTAFVIAFFLRDFGTTGVFAFIAGSMAVVMLSVGVFASATPNSRRACRRGSRCQATPQA